MIATARLAAILALLLATAACASAPEGDAARFRGGYAGVTGGGASGR